MQKILIVIDMQNDFISGSLGTKEANNIIPYIIEKCKQYNKNNIFATRDTHFSNYLDTLEGKMLPVKHCIHNTDGWKIHSKIAPYIPKENIINKNTFGSFDLIEKIKEKNKEEETEIELVGLCTDICVVSNAILLRSAFPQNKITVDANCCAGVTPQKHTAALEIMTSCQIEII